MNILIAAIGKLKESPEKTLFEQYRKRLRFPIKVIEFANQLTKGQEGEMLLSAIPGGSFVVALDEKGKQLSSVELAQEWDKWQFAAPSTLAFLIGGADGLSVDVKERANFLWSLGKLTWPHFLVRGLLLEQIYRAQQILTGHPYHRE
jgi:23S rRNA (pseudouridine1915-N3)-methyltransferase